MFRNPTFYKVAFVCIVAAALMFMVISIVHHALHGDLWDEEELAIRAAYAQSDIKQVNEVQPFNFEGSYMIVFGEDEVGEQMIVWVAMSSDESLEAETIEDTTHMTAPQVVHQAYASEGYNRNLLRLKMRETLPEVDVIKMTPGKYNDEWVWEVLYRKAPKEKRTYYDYYRFSDGALLQTLTMITP